MGENGQNKYKNVQNQLMSSLVKSFYVGEYARQIDEKMRVTIPVKWRSDSIDETFLALPNPIGCLTIYPPKMVNVLEDKVSQVSLGDTKAQIALAKLFSKADTFSCDSKWRIKLDEKLLNFAKIKSEVIFIGGGAVFNIWDPDIFQKYISNEQSEDISSIFRGLGL